MNGTCPDTQSARSCGCDPGANHLCEQHRQMIQAIQAWQANIGVREVTDTKRCISVTGIAPARATTIPTEAVDRKAHPVASGVLDYFPDALVAIAHVSWVGNEQHNPGQRLHWAREKSTDEADALIRHFLQRGLLDSDGMRHSAKMAWRALALLQKEIEAERGVK